MCSVFPGTDNALLTDRSPAEVMIHDDLCDCPYIDGQIARMPLRLPIRPLEPHEFDERLAQGDRRHGVSLARRSRARGAVNGARIWRSWPRT